MSSTGATRIAKLQQECRDLESRAYVLAGLISDKLTSEEAQGRYKHELLTVEQENTRKTAERVRLQQTPQQSLF